MAVIIKIPTWCTFNKIPVGTPALGLTTLNAAMGLSLAEGDANPVWADLQDLNLGGAPLNRGALLTALAEVTAIQNTAFLLPAQIQLAVVVGGDVIDAPLWFKVAEADYGNDVPAILPNATKEAAVLDESEEPVLDEDGEPTYETVAKTWVEWNAVAHSGPWDGYYYIPSSAGNRMLPNASLIVGTQLSFATEAEYLAVAPDPSPV